MDASVKKLAMKLGDAELARALVGAGYKNPVSIENATDGELRDIPGIGASKLAQIREKMPKA